jgi:hypothetical protein
MRCDACKHWQKDSEFEEWEAQRAGFGECLAVRARWRIQEEATKGLVWDDRDTSQYVTKQIDALRAHRAYVQDGSQYRAELFTAPDFFCALFHVG